MHSPLSLPQVSGKASETGKKREQDAQTFKYDGILRAPKVAKGLRDLVGHNMYKFWFINENIEFVDMAKVLGRVNFEFVPIFLRRCREFRVKMRVLPESQTVLLVLEMAEVPQNLFKAWTVTEHLWHRN
jgi:hypothetical protein